MGKHIKNLNINHFRGLHDLQLEDLQEINVILGGNNVGKTSVLEAIELFCHQNEAGVLSLARQRETRKLTRSKLTDVESIRYLFPINQPENNEIFIEGELESSGNLSLNCRYSLETLICTTEETEEEEELSTDEVEVTKLHFYMTSQNENQSTFETSFEIQDKDRKRISKSESLIPVVTVHVIDHLTGNPFKDLTSNKETKDTAVELLQTFDENIIDLRNIDDDNRMIPMIEYKGEKDYIPLTLYGDGLKKSLTLLQSLILAKNGILLIDEYETALHTSAMKPVFLFLLETAKKLNVQLFMTTHSIEAVDKLLECQDYLDEISIIRLDQEDKTYSTIFSGRGAKENRKKYSVELRI